MGSFLDNVWSGAKSAAENVGKFAGGVADYSKLKIDISDKKRKLEDKYKKLGKLVYAYKVNGCENDEEILALIEKISAVNSEIDCSEAKIADLQEKIKCSDCEFFNDKDANYCKKCGSKIEKPVFECEVVEEAEETEAEAEEKAE